MDLNEIFIFTKVVQAKSFSAAAKELGMPNSTVSMKISSLEARLGLTLIQRTTRKLKLTSEGESYYQSVVKNVENLLAAEEDLLDSADEVKGILKITAPIHLGVSLLPSIIKDFQVEFPNVLIDLNLSDETSDLITEGIDLAIRAGELNDSGFISKNLGVSYFVPFASKQYVKKHGQPQSPKDLESHDALVFSALSKDSWYFKNQKSEQTITIKSKIVSNEIELIKKMLLLSQGVALLPTFSCFEEHQRGELIRLLPGWSSLTKKISFVYPSQKKVSRRVRAFIDFATPYLKESLKEREV